MAETKVLALVLGGCLPRARELVPEDEISVDTERREWRWHGCTFRMGERCCSRKPPFVLGVYDTGNVDDLKAMVSHAVHKVESYIPADDDED